MTARATERQALSSGYNPEEGVRVLHISDAYRVVYSSDSPATFYEFRAYDATGCEIWMPSRVAEGPKIHLPAPMVQQIPRVFDRMFDEIATKLETMLANGRDGAAIAAKIREGRL
jgi:hypothetical protein